MNRKCRMCRQPYTPTRPMQVVCSPACAIAAAGKRREADAKAQRAVTRAALAGHKRLPELHKEAQQAFNRWIRARDIGQPCICCGAMPQHSPLTGGVWDAGHYRSVGSAPHMRYDEDNCHAQLKRCNRDGAGRAVDYRIGLIARIGLARVEALESNNAPHKWSRDEVIAIRDEYRARLRATK